LLDRISLDIVYCMRLFEHVTSSDLFEAPHELMAEAMMSWRDRISADPGICHGKACIGGTRVLVSVILDNLAEGYSVDRIVSDYPGLTADDVRAAMEYAAELARERVLPLRESV
jgi:uncharacterized protein (DUF433 family)